MGEENEEPIVIKRTRAHKPKVRTGCVTCKARRVKCDETKPFCLKCTQSGRKCGGYVALNTWVFEIKEKNEASAEQLLALPPSAPPSSAEYSDPLESRALLYYRERAAPVLANFTTEAQDFFNMTVPQASQSLPVVKHMVVAAASLKEAVECSKLDESVICREFFWNHYSKAVTSLTKTDTTPPTEVVLMSCLLFLSCENFQGSTLAGSLHIQSGLKILQDWKSSIRQKLVVADSAADVIQTQIEPIFARLEIQMSIYSAPREPQLSYPTPESPHLQIPPILPSSFNDLFGARDSLDDIMQWTFHAFNTDIDIENDSSTTSISHALLDQWLQSFKALTFSITDQSSIESRTASSLIIHYHILSVYLSTKSSPSEIVYDRYASDFRALLLLSERIIMHREYGHTNSWSEYSHRMSLFESDFGFIPPLFFIALHCRDPALRRKSIRLLRYLHRAEGVWDTCAAAKIAEGVIGLEERSHPPQRVRVVDADIDPRWPSSVVVRFTREGSERVVEEELIDWASWSRSELASLTAWPLESVIRNAGYQGLVRPVAGACLCKVYQAQIKYEEFTPAEEAVKGG